MALFDILSQSIQNIFTTGQAAADRFMEQERMRLSAHQTAVGQALQYQGLQQQANAQNQQFALGLKGLQQQQDIANMNATNQSTQAAAQLGLQRELGTRAADLADAKFQAAKDAQSQQDQLAAAQQERNDQIKALVGQAFQEGGVPAASDVLGRLGFVNEGQQMMKTYSDANKSLFDASKAQTDSQAAQLGFAASNVISSMLAAPDEGSRNAMYNNFRSVAGQYGLELPANPSPEVIAGLMNAGKDYNSFYTKIATDRNLAGPMFNALNAVFSPEGHQQVQSFTQAFSSGIVPDKGLTVNVNQSTKGAADERFKRLFAATDAAADINNTLDSLDSALNQLEGTGLEPGSFGEVKLQGAKALQRLGYKGNQEQIAAAELLQSQAIDAALTKIQKTKGAISDREMKLFLSAIPSLNNTLSGNRQIISTMRAINDRVTEKEQFFVQKSDEGVSYSEINKQWNEYINNNPLIDSSKLGGAKTGSTSAQDILNKLDSFK